MKLAMVGLGRMGSNMAKRLLRDGHEIVAFDRNDQAVQEMKKEGAKSTPSLKELKKPFKRAAHGVGHAAFGRANRRNGSRARRNSRAPVTSSSTAETPTLKTTCAARKCSRAKKIRYLDVGTSGGVWGLERGYSLMIGGDESAAKELDSVFRSLAPGSGKSGDVEITPDRKIQGPADQGYLYCGPNGSGHFVKMVHNGIEYGMMQALAEGFDILRGAQSEELPAELRYNLNLTEISEVWRRGSVVSSWLLDLIAISLNRDSKLSKFEGHVADSGEGRWTVQAAIEEGVPATVLTSALYTRFRSREENSFAEKMLSAMRNAFGGHSEAPLENLGKPTSRAS